jgi:hypothetical protein
MQEAGGSFIERGGHPMPRDIATPMPGTISAFDALWAPQPSRGRELSAQNEFTCCGSCTIRNQVAAGGSESLCTIEADGRPVEKVIGDNLRGQNAELLRIAHSLRIGYRCAPLGLRLFVTHGT